MTVTFVMCFRSFHNSNNAKSYILQVKLSFILYQSLKLINLIVLNHDLSEYGACQIRCAKFIRPQLLHFTMSDAINIIDQVELYRTRYLQTTNIKGLGAGPKKMLRTPLVILFNSDSLKARGAMA